MTHNDWNLLIYMMQIQMTEKKKIKNLIQNITYIWKTQFKFGIFLASLHDCNKTGVVSTVTTIVLKLRMMITLCKAYQSSPLKFLTTYR